MVFFFGFFFPIIYADVNDSIKQYTMKGVGVDLFADAWVNISGSNQSGLKKTFSAEFEVFNGFNNLEQNRCLTISSCMEETGLIYDEN